MKKIGIISYFNYYNYGSMLQGFALQKYINDISDDIDCEIINYRDSSDIHKSYIELIRLRIKRLSYYITHLKEVFSKAKYASLMSLRKTYFDAFLNDDTNVSTTFYRSKKQLIDNPPLYDIYITGSDQTWSPKIEGYAYTPMFLDFAVKGSKKTAYAPSLGVGSLTEEQKNILKEKLSGYSLISCRESRGAEILGEVSRNDVPVVVDPTLLITGRQWREIMVKPQINEPYIFCYFLGSRQYYRDFVNQLSHQTGLPIIYIPVNWKDYSEENNRIWDAGPKEFVGLIEGATYVCTDSFHGVAFSSNLNKDFYAFVKHEGNANAGDNSRLFDFLNRIGLADRLLTSFNGGIIDIKPINYPAINEKINEERSNSYSFLERLVSL